MKTTKKVQLENKGYIEVTNMSAALYKAIIRKIAKKRNVLPRDVEEFATIAGQSYSYTVYAKTEEIGRAHV